MMNCFPLLYEDELFYSIISRYKRMCGITSKKALMKDLYGSNITQSSMYFPTHISDLIKNLPYSSKITEDTILKNHTLYPFYTAFLSKSKTQNIYASVKKGRGQKIILKLGMVGNNRELNQYLKFCPICFKEDIDKLGESYWRRLHQIPGVFYCIKHECQLVESKVKVANCRVEQNCADEDTCVDNNMIHMEDKFKKLNIGLGKQVFYLLKNEVERKELDFIIDFYIDRLRDRKLASSSGQIRMKELQREFVAFYTHEYLKIMKSDIDTEKDYNWLKVFVRHNNKDRNPIRHLLFLQFLGISVEELFKCNEVIGRIKTFYIPSPMKERDEMRKKWLKIIKENPEASRTELKEIGKGVHTWIFKHDRDWYEKVSPPKRKKEVQRNFIDWEKRDEECLKMTKKAVQEILEYEGKPVRVCKATIRRHLGLNTWFNNSKLIKTNEYINRVKEDTTSYRIRKIRWAIDEMLEKGEKITPYKVQLYAGFGGNNKEVRPLIENELINIDLLKENSS